MNANSVGRSLALSTVLALLFVSSACSGSSKPLAEATTPTTSAASTSAVSTSAVSTSAATPPSQETVTTASPPDALFPPVAGSDPVTFDASLAVGSGPFTMQSTTTGLADLASYQATLTLSFDGTNSGQPSKWSRTYVMLATKDPASRQLTIVTTGDASDPDPVYRAETGGVSYEQLGQGPCTADLIRRRRVARGKRFEPAGFLAGIVGADVAGNEDVNGSPAAKYTFDENALGQTSPVKSTGEVWVAATGGYILRYQLATTAGPDYFGEGVDGTLTWDYELSSINQPVALTLPDGCPPGLVNAPQLPDASNIVSLPAVFSYDTATSLADVMAFYQGSSRSSDGLPGTSPPSRIQRQSSSSRKVPRQ